MLAGSTARDRYDAACHRQPNTQVPVSPIFDRASTQSDQIELANLWQAAVEGAQPCDRPGAGPSLTCGFYVEPPAGIEPATPSLPWNHQEPLCEPLFPQVTPDRRGQSYRFSFGQVMRSLQPCAGRLWGKPESAPRYEPGPLLDSIMVRSPRQFSPATCSYARSDQSFHVGVRHCNQAPSLMSGLATCQSSIISVVGRSGEMELGWRSRSAGEGWAGFSCRRGSQRFSPLDSHQFQWRAASWPPAPARSGPGWRPGA
jgi:hypothetical protein